MLDLIGKLACKRVKTAIGLMSGTSLDGIDAAVVRMTGTGVDAKAECIAFYTVAYDDALRDQLKALCKPGGADAQALCSMNVHLAKRFAAAALEAAAMAGLRPDEIDFIGSHGQTVWHQPVLEDGVPFCERSTLQIGDISFIAKLTGVPTVGDFRPADMAAGGLGAPLTPYADYLLFRHPRFGRIVQNIGGIGNCAVIPAGAEAAAVTAFDTGPGNMLLDQAIVALSGGAMSYDKDGSWASAGTVDAELVEQFMRHPYFAAKPPKTTGREMFGEAVARQWLERADAKGLSASDTAATFTAFTAHAIARSYRDFIMPRHEVAEVIVSGGGARNPAMMGMLAKLLPELRLYTSDELGISGDAKEAIAFALLANDTIHGVPNTLPAVTGAAAATVMGKLALP
ncbi:MAG: anhydro-N-acetylmuramic acid kinase [Paenibacillaceae bacterium]|nr:anhydro-N-acetylmuramic acid kinase [Paenibacillaceae bacterium]